jgi:1-acyl-sn-glycerol-3-phosphate acyltransferase
MTFGEPMYFEGDSRDALFLRECADAIMKRIQQMSGQEYVDTYAVKGAKPNFEEEEQK